MNLDIVKGNWKKLTGEAKIRWSNLTDDELLNIDGQRDKLCGLLQARYGYAKERAEKEIEDWNTVHNVW